MRKIFISLLIISMLVGFSSAALYPQKINQGTAAQTNVAGATNAMDLIVVQKIPGTLTATLRGVENSDDDQFFNATGGKLNTTTKLVINSTGAHSAYFRDQPDVPRNVIGTVNASTNLSVKLTGTDIANAAITENLTWASATGVKASTKAFKTVARVDATLTTGETAKTLKLGTGDLLGLNTKLSNNTVIMDVVGTTKDTVAATVTVSATNLSLNTIDTTTAPGGYVTRVWFMVPA
jgi:hypothetical protein